MPMLTMPASLQMLAMRLFAFMPPWLLLGHAESRTRPYFGLQRMQDGLPSEARHVEQRLHGLHMCMVLTLDSYLLSGLCSSFPTFQQLTRRERAPTCMWLSPQQQRFCDNYEHSHKYSALSERCNCEVLVLVQAGRCEGAGCAV